MGSDRKLYAIYPNGTKKWSYPVDGLIWSTPAIAEDGTIYVGSWDTGLYALYPNGTKKWRFGTGNAISSSPVIADDGTIYFGTMWGDGSGGKIFSINPDGAENWQYKTGYHIVSDPAIGNDGTIYIGSSDNHLYAFYPNGTIRWKFGTGGYVQGHPSIADDGTIYFPSLHEYLYALYPNGTVKWKLNTGGSGSSAAIANDGTVVYYDDKLYAISPANGSVKWSLDLGDNGGTSPAISADGTIFVCDNFGRSLVAVSLNGTEIWRKIISNLYARSSPVIGQDGIIYVGSTQKDEETHSWFGYLHAFGPVESNDAPYTPTITGETNGKIRTEYKYYITAEDPDNNPVHAYVDWGDGTNTTTRNYASGETIFVTHKWTRRDTYTIRAKIIDSLGEESDWGTLEVTMPKISTISMGKEYFSLFLLSC